MGCAAIALTFAQYFCGLFIDDDSPSYTFVKKISASLAIGRKQSGRQNTVNLRNNMKIKLSISHLLRLRYAFVTPHNLKHVRE